MSGPEVEVDTSDLQIGDVVRVKKHSGATVPLEIDFAGDDWIDGKIPYRSTYEAGGRYEGSYRGRLSAWKSQVVEIVRRAEP